MALGQIIKTPCEHGNMPEGMGKRLIQSRENSRKVFRNHPGTSVQFPNLTFDKILLTVS